MERDCDLREFFQRAATVYEYMCMATFCPYYDNEIFELF